MYHIRYRYLTSTLIHQHTTDCPHEAEQWADHVRPLCRWVAIRKA